MNPLSLHKMFSFGKKTNWRKSLSALCVALAISIGACSQESANAQNPLKHEFRGAWLHTVHQDQYKKQNTAQNKAYIIDQLDKLQEAGINAIIFQVRPTADAFYKSRHEPWSRFLTDGGKAPSPYWDPLAFIIEEAHARGMELHAWLNPYRATSSDNEVLPKSHIYHKHPERFITFNGKLYFDPALPENRKFIEDVVVDIITHYDVDGIHFDDYFYPYPVKGQVFNDDASYQKYGKGMNRGDWRRLNVDMLIEQLNRRIKKERPWVRFGISPFGIWRNKASDPRGSETNGLQNYDDLYADVLLWAKNGWIDYLLPQLYWTLDYKVAPYLGLVDWWADNGQGRHVYIGQDVDRTMKTPDLEPSTNPTQLEHKIRLTRNNDKIQGNCWWPGYEITANNRGIADSLITNHQRTLAIPPQYPWISTDRPSKPKSVKIKDNYLTWDAAKIKGHTNDPVKFVVYQFYPNETVDVNDHESIVAITSLRKVELPKGVPSGTVYLITALNRVNNESDPVKFVVK